MPKRSSSSPTRAAKAAAARPPAVADGLGKASGVGHADARGARSRAVTLRDLRVDVQLATRRADVPGAASLRRWARAAHIAALQALSPRRLRAVAPGIGVAPSLGVRVVGAAESHRLNLGFRRKDKPTNVLSFPSSAAERLLDGALGDLVVCAPVVAREAGEQGKPLRAHWAHMLVHGTLHLLGYDHEQPRAARAMEALEVEILRRLGFDDPYRWSPPEPYE